MNRKIHRFQTCLPVFLLLFLPSILSAQTPTAVSGSYTIAKEAAVDGQVQVSMQIHLVSRASGDLLIRRITLWDLVHPHPGATQPCSIRLLPGASTDTHLNFVIPPAERAMWKRGTRPRLVLEVALPNGQVTTSAIQLNPRPNGRGN